MTTSVPFLDLTRGIVALRGEIDAAIDGVLTAGSLVLGPAVEEFEAAFGRHCGATHAVGVANGTDALTIALQAVGVTSGDEVITAANTCVPTVAAIEAVGATPVLVDVDPGTHTLDPARLSEATGVLTRAIVPVHLYGQCADMAPIVEFARDRGLAVVEDAAQAHGAAYGGRRAGTLGDAAAFSFYPTKNLGALGDGGAVVTNDGAVAERARLLRNYGERQRYESVCTGGNSRLDALQAAVLTRKLEHLDAWTARRREIADRYLTAFSGHGVGLPAEATDREHVYHLFVLTVDDRDPFRRVLGDRGIQTLVHYPRPIHHHPAYRHLAPANRSLDRCELLSHRVVSLPLYPELRDDEIRQVIEAVQTAVPALAGS
jgi:dTDP-4-amino-4,6-dideoxygalactose transaminase